MLIEISDAQITKLIECKKTKQRAFKDWEIRYLLGEAINEFHQKYTETKKTKEPEKKEETKTLCAFSFCTKECVKGENYCLHHR